MISNQKDYKVKSQQIKKLLLEIIPDKTVSQVPGQMGIQGAGRKKTVAINERWVGLRGEQNNPLITPLNYVFF